MIVSVTSHVSQFQFHARSRHNHFRAGKIGFQHRSHPFDRGRIAMYEKNFRWCKFFRVVDERLACRVRAELKLLDVAAHALSRPDWVERNFALYRRIAQKAGRRLRIGVTYKKDGVLWVVD